MELSFRTLELNIHSSVTSLLELWIRNAIFFHYVLTFSVAKSEVQGMKAHNSSGEDGGGCTVCKHPGKRLVHLNILT